MLISYVRKLEKLLCSVFNTILSTQARMFGDASYFLTEMSPTIT